MRIIHLSDIHLSKENLKDFKQYYLSALVDDLLEINKKQKIDLVVITGDLVDKGGHSFQSHLAYKEFEKEFISPINSKVSIGLNNFVFIPGNHDIDESQIDEYSEEGIKSKLNTVEKINRFIDDYHKKDHDAIKRNQHFKKFERKYFKKFKDKNISNFESCYIHSIEGKKIGIAGFNSAWRCSTKLRANDLLLGTRQILNANQFFDINKCDFVVALVHHPIYRFSIIERTEIDSFFQKLHFDMLLMGHIHESETEYNIGNRGNIFTSIARSSFSDPREKIDKFHSGYEVIDVDLDTLHVELNYRKYYHRRLCFDVDNEYINQGKFETELIPRKEREPFLKLLKLNNKSLIVNRQEINDSLLISNTDTIAPKDLNSIFVTPKLSETPLVYNYDDLIKPNFVTIGDLILDKNKIVLFGMKEIGKTTILNKIYLELAQNFSKYQLIPIILDFSSLKNKKVKSLISKYLNESMNEVEVLLKQKKVLILIDNFTEEDSARYALKSIDEFVKEFPEIKIIMTTSDLYEIIISKKQSFIDSYKFKPIHIGYVSVYEFKELTNKWFNKRNPAWLQNNIEKLIKVFEVMRIPRTFFAVTLFLWIIEKQENYSPINKDNLLSSFLQLILEGLKIENAEAGSYNYNKKIELLSEIASKMYTEGSKEKGYCLTKAEVLQVLVDNFKLNQRDWQTEEKFNEFLEKGILKNDEGMIIFRYECFFEYFLSLNISKNTEFKDHVFSDDNFLSFIEEIDFHTARNQNDSKSLMWIMDKLSIAFAEIDEMIKDDELDKYLPTESLLIKEIKSQKFLDEYKRKKLNDAQIEETLNKQMDQLPVNDSIRIKKKHDLNGSFHKVLELASRILKNSENIKNPELVNTSLQSIIRKTAKYSIFLRSIAIKRFYDEIKKHPGDEDEIQVPFDQFIEISFTPLINQLLLLTWIGTEFLTVPIRNEIDRILKLGKGTMPEFELFLYTSLYSDLKLKDFHKKMDECIKWISNGYIAELLFFKVSLYYMFRPENSSDIPNLEKQLKKLFSKARNISSKQAEAFVEKTLRKTKKEFRN